MNTRRILDLRAGESAFAPTHAAWINGHDMYLNGNYPIHRVGGGSFGLRLVKFPNGKLAVDLTHCHGTRFDSIAAFAGDVPPVRVDMALEAPLPDPDHRRIFDVKPGDFAFISTTSAWVFGEHMWLDGSAATSDTKSGDTPLFIERRLDGSYVIDNHYCQDALYSTDWRAEHVWPIQVLEAIRSRRLH
jgi:hypothetical protein